MDKDELYELLDIEAPSDFEYFENLAALIECEEHIEFEELYALLKDVNKESLLTLISNYFEEISDFDTPDIDSVQSFSSSFSDFDKDESFE